MSTERDELDELLNRVIKGDRFVRRGVIADAILEAGYRKPRIITTREEVYALAEDAVLMDSAGDVAQLRGGLWCGYETSPMAPQRQAKYLPSTVLHEGETQK